jgi:phosphoesterase RecJ-like protein
MTIAREIQRAAQVLKEGNTFFLCTHTQPDGDALGSMLGLAAVLEEMGKTLIVHTPEPAPRLYGFLPGVDWLDHDRGPEGCDAVVVLDCGSLSRIGPKAADVDRHPVVINLDHHQTGATFGTLRIVDSDACATGELVRRLIAAIPREVGPATALNLYVAVASDTGNFQNASTDRQAFELAAEMTGHGVNPAHVARRLFDDYSLARLRLLGLTLGNLETLAGGRLVLLSVTRARLAQAGAELEDTAGLINQVSAMAGVEVIALLTEGEGPRIDVSLRSRNGVNVADVAENLGGGGHPNAAGCSLSAPFKKARTQVIHALSAAIEGAR